jgi:hypothetical protein
MLLREPQMGFVWIAISATRKDLITSNVAVVLKKGRERGRYQRY